MIEFLCQRDLLSTMQWVWKPPCVPEDHSLSRQKSSLIKWAYTNSSSKMTQDDEIRLKKRKNGRKKKPKRATFLRIHIDNQFAENRCRISSRALSTFPSVWRLENNWFVFLPLLRTFRISFPCFLCSWGFLFCWCYQGLLWMPWCSSAVHVHTKVRSRIFCVSFPFISIACVYTFTCSINCRVA